MLIRVEAYFFFRNQILTYKIRCGVSVVKMELMHVKD